MTLGLFCRVAGCWLAILALTTLGLRALGLDGATALFIGLIVAPIVSDRVLR